MKKTFRPALSRETLARVSRQLAEMNPGCAVMVRVGTSVVTAPAMGDAR